MTDNKFTSKNLYQVSPEILPPGDESPAKPRLQSQSASLEPGSPRARIASSHQDRLKGQRTANAIEDILDKNYKIADHLAVKRMGPEQREYLLTVLERYQLVKGRIYMCIIGWWLVSIVLGLVAMTVEEFITEMGMFAAWAVLFLSNAAFVLAHKLCDKSKVNRIVGTFKEEHKDAVIANPLAAASKV